MIRHIKLGAVLFVLIMGSALSAHAQVSAGAVLGTVSDTSGALIPGVTITVTNEGTNQSRQAITSETGTYRVEPLQQGVYTVTAELTVSVSLLSPTMVRLLVGGVKVIDSLPVLVYPRPR